VPYGGTATYTGTTPTNPAGREFLGFVPTGENIKGDTTCRAQFAYEYEYAEITDSWDDIIESIDDGTYSYKYKIGNYKSLDLGTEGIVNMQIAAMNLDPLASGDGYAPITFLCEHILATEKAIEDNKSTWDGKGETCALRSYLKNEIKPLVPTNVRNRLVDVTKQQREVSGNSLSTTRSTVDDVWIPSVAEFGRGRTYGEYGDTVYTDLNRYDDRIRKKANSDQASTYWTRSYATGAPTATDMFYFCVNVDGSLGVHRQRVQGTCGICLGFCLGTSEQVASQGE
jgi:hypothetical protein